MTTAVIAPKDMIPDISNGIDMLVKVNVPQPIVYVNIDGKIPSKVDKARSTPSIFDKAIGNAMGAVQWEDLILNLHRKQLQEQRLLKELMVLLYM